MVSQHLLGWWRSSALKAPNLSNILCNATHSIFYQILFCLKPLLFTWKTFYFSSSPTLFPNYMLLPIMLSVFFPYSLSTSLFLLFLKLMKCEWQRSCTCVLRFVSWWMTMLSCFYPFSWNLFSGLCPKRTKSPVCIIPIFNVNTSTKPPYDC